MIRRLLRFTLFLYTTLFRSPAEDADIGNALADYLRSEGLDVYTDVRVDRVNRGSDGYRSEEHTSELRSHSDLVCRLPREKKQWTIRSASGGSPGASTTTTCL